MGGFWGAPFGAPLFFPLNRGSGGRTRSHRGAIRGADFSAFPDGLTPPETARDRLSGGIGGQSQGGPQ